LTWRSEKLAKEKIPFDQDVNLTNIYRYLDELYNTQQEKIADDAKWDGLKGYITNTTLSAKDVYEQ
jgi:hypothetical protein